MSLLENKKAYFDYEVLEKFDAGIKLLGFEVKALKLKRGSLIGSHAIIRGGEAFVVGMKIMPYQPNNTPADYDTARTRKLLLAKKEIEHLSVKDSQKGLTLIPLTIYTKNGLIKMSLGVARGLKKYDKREKIKERDTRRDVERELKMRG
ncbi:SsrA-binding protein SmpB [Patescibacteria group bacterium]|nr:SsrA-binding protein SmpB [Patescibacteria group bacterium]MBU2632893.1 SsrA-binding protein SmpB [Patescibacteria group bacterium]